MLRRHNRVQFEEGNARGNGSGSGICHFENVLQCKRKQKKKKLEFPRNDIMFLAEIIQAQHKSIQIVSNFV